MTASLRRTSFLLLLFSYSCSLTDNCHDEINLIPMYGRQKKCGAQFHIDQDFIAKMDNQTTDRKKAAMFYVDNGWYYFYKNDFDSSMRRFNQAWLLDSLNADVYWGFGNILGMKHQFNESLPLLETSIKLNPTNPHVYQCIATSYGQLYFETKKTSFLNKSIDNLKTAIQLDPNNASVLGQLTGAYSYFIQKDSAKKYLRLTDKLDPKSVNPDVRKILADN